MSFDGTSKWTWFVVGAEEPTFPNFVLSGFTDSLADVYMLWIITLYSVKVTPTIKLDLALIELYIQWAIPIFLPFKLLMFLLFIWHGTYWFWCRQIYYRGDWKGWALKIETFLGPEMATSKASAIWAQESQDFQCPPLPMAQVMNLPPSKVQAPYIKTGTLVILCTWVLLVDISGPENSSVIRAHPF